MHGAALVWLPGSGAESASALRFRKKLFRIRIDTNADAQHWCTLKGLGKEILFYNFFL
jgi:hypothetical protein